MRGKSYSTYDKTAENKSISQYQKRMDEHRIMKKRFEQSSKIVDILNTVETYIRICLAVEAPIPSQLCSVNTNMENYHSQTPFHSGICIL